MRRKKETSYEWNTQFPRYLFKCSLGNWCFFVIGDAAVSVEACQLIQNKSIFLQKYEEKWKIRSCLQQKLNGGDGVWYLSQCYWWCGERANNTGKIT